MIGTMADLTRRRTLAFIAILGAPAVWALHLLVSYGLVAVACQTGGVLLLHGVTVVAALLTLGTGAAGWRFKTLAQAHPDPDGSNVSMDRFLWYVALTTSLLFFVVVLVQGLPNFFLSPCLF